jgi:hypothetical protein
MHYDSIGETPANGSLALVADMLKFRTVTVRD